MYATGTGSYSVLNDAGKETVYPRVALLFFDQIGK